MTLFEKVTVGFPVTVIDVQNAGMRALAVAVALGEYNQAVLLDNQCDTPSEFSSLQGPLIHPDVSYVIS
jgi:hypothetical protein